MKDNSETPPERKKGGKKSTGARKHRNSHARELAMQAIYQIEVVNQPVEKVLRFDWLREHPPASTKEYASKLISDVTENWDALDEVLASFSSKDITQISIIIRCILRIGLIELMEGEIDPRIIMDDLLNLTRQYDGEKSVGFVNGILDSFEKEKRENRG